LEYAYDSSINSGIIPKLLIIINPGNPTAKILSEDTIKFIIMFAYDRKM